MRPGGLFNALKCEDFNRYMGVSGRPWLRIAAQSVPRTEKTFGNYFSGKKKIITLCPIWSRAPAVAGILGSFSPTSCGASDRGALTLAACRPSFGLRLRTCRRDPRGLLCGFSRLVRISIAGPLRAARAVSGPAPRPPAGPCTGYAMPRGLRLPCASCGAVIHGKKGIQFIRYQHDIPGPQGTPPGKSPVSPGKSPPSPYSAALCCWPGSRRSDPGAVI